jgi:predicted DNA-binding protein
MAQKKTAAKPAAKKRENTVHARLPIEEIEKLDALAKANNITRAAVIGIACARILKSGL